MSVFLSISKKTIEHAKLYIAVDFGEPRKMLGWRLLEKVKHPSKLFENGLSGIKLIGFGPNMVAAFGRSQKRAAAFGRRYAAALFGVHVLSFFSHLSASSHFLASGIPESPEFRRSPISGDIWMTSISRTSGNPDFPYIRKIWNSGCLLFLKHMITLISEKSEHLDCS